MLNALYLKLFYKNNIVQMTKCLHYAFFVSCNMNIIWKNLQNHSKKNFQIHSKVRINDQLHVTLALNTVFTHFDGVIFKNPWQDKRPSDIQVMTFSSFTQILTEWTVHQLLFLTWIQNYRCVVWCTNHSNTEVLKNVQIWKYIKKKKVKNTRVDILHKNILHKHFADNDIIYHTD